MFVLDTMESTLTSIGFLTSPGGIDLKFIMHCFYFFRIIDCLPYFMIRKTSFKIYNIVKSQAVEQYLTSVAYLCFLLQW